MATELRCRPEDELLVKLVGAAPEIPVHKTGIVGLSLLWIANCSRQHDLGETGGKPLELPLDQVRHVLVAALIFRWNVPVAVQRVLALGSA